MCVAIASGIFRDQHLTKFVLRVKKSCLLGSEKPPCHVKSNKSEEKKNIFFHPQQQ